MDDRLQGGLAPASCPQPRELNLLFGRILGFGTLDEAVRTGAADVVPLGRAAIESAQHGASTYADLVRDLRHHSVLPLLGAVSFIDEVPELPLRINQELGRDRLDLVKAARLVGNKESFYRALEASGLRMPQRVLVRSVADLSEALASVSLPLDRYIIKPVTGTESRGVIRPAPGAGIQHVAALVGSLRDIRPSEPLMIMELVAGDEFCVDGVVCDGELVFHAVHEKVRTHWDYPIHDRLMLTPPRGGTPNAGRVASVIRILPRILSCSDFVFHLEFRLDADGTPVPIDMSLRPGGGLIHRSVLAAYGVDLRLAHCLCAVGLTGELRRTCQYDSGGPSVAIGAYFGNGQSRDKLKGRLAALLGCECDLGLTAYDVSKVSVLSSGSQLAKPDVGLCVQSASPQGALTRIEQVAKFAGATVEPSGCAIAGNRLIVGEIDHQVDLPALHKAAVDIAIHYPCVQGRAAGVRSVDLVQLKLVEATEGDVAARIEGLASHVFDTDEGPLFRLSVIRVDRGRDRLVLCIHKSLAPTWVQVALLPDLANRYSTHCGACLGELPICVHGNSARYALLPRPEMALVPTSLPGDAPLLAAAPASLDRLEFRIPGGTVDVLHAVAKQTGAALFDILWISLACMLRLYTGARSVMTACPAASRVAGEANCVDRSGYDMIGVDFIGRSTLLELLAATEAAPLATAKLVDDSSPRVPILFAYSPQAQPLSFACSLASFAAAAAASSDYDVEVHLQADHSGLRGAFLYRADLFSHGRIQRLRDHYLHVLGQVGANPNRDVFDLRLTSESERQHLLALGACAPSQDRFSNCVEEISLQATRTPGAPAVSCGTNCVSYAELELISDRIVGSLKSRGVGAHDVVALLAHPCVELVAGMLAILKCGAAYLPVDPANPHDRVQHFLDHAQPRAILTQPALAVNVPTRLAGRVLALHPLTGAERATAERGHHGPIAPGMLAYVIYTSGSTGRPKGVMVTHAGVANLARWYGDRLGLSRGRRNLIATSIGFDLTQKNILATLCFGGQVVLSAQGASSGHELAELVGSECIQVLNCAPSQLVYAFDERSAHAAKLSHLVLGGEPIPADIVSRARSEYPGLQILNTYGPTEIADVCAQTDVDDPCVDAQFSVIGRPLPRTRLYVLDENLEPVPIGVAGELYIGGVGVARGYLHAPALTAERFLPDPFEGDGHRMYRSGDIVRWEVEGRVRYLGRSDHQVKVNGIRVELGEIESALMTIQEVVQSAVIALKAQPGEVRLVGFVTLGKGARSSTAQLRECLQRCLPSSMVPSELHILDQLPLTRSGKLDRQSLFAYRLTTEVECDGQHRSATEEKLSTLWREVTGAGHVNRSDNFFESGGTSLSVSRLVARIRVSMGIELRVSEVFERPQFSELAAHLEHVTLASSPGSRTNLPPIQARARTPSSDDRSVAAKKAVREFGTAQIIRRS